MNPTDLSESELRAELRRQADDHPELETIRDRLTRRRDVRVRRTTASLLAAAVVVVLLLGVTLVAPRLRSQLPATPAGPTHPVTPTSPTAAAPTTTSPTSATKSPIATGSSVSVAALHRPLRLPTIRPGQPCPVTLSQHQPDPDLGVVQGTGPAGPVGISARGALQYEAPAQSDALTDKSWGAVKVLWAVDSAVNGPVLVRGRQLDGPNGLRFNDPAVAEMLLAVTKDAFPGGWRDYPGYARLQAPGCYAYQVDAPSGSTVIVFRAEGPAVGSSRPSSTSPPTSSQPATSGVRPSTNTANLRVVQAAQLTHVKGFIAAYNAGDVQGAISHFSQAQPVGFSDCDYTTQQLVQGRGREQLTAWLSRNIAQHDRLVVASIVDANPDQPIGVLGVSFSRRSSDAIARAGRPNGITPTASAKVIFDGAGLITEFANGPYGGPPDGCRIG